jgi:hypothetical protein
LLLPFVQTRVAVARFGRPTEFLSFAPRFFGEPFGLTISSSSSSSSSSSASSSSCSSSFAGASFSISAIVLPVGESRKSTIALAMFSFVSSVLMSFRSRMVAVCWSAGNSYVSSESSFV